LAYVRKPLDARINLSCIPIDRVEIVLVGMLHMSMIFWRLVELMRLVDTLKASLRSRRLLLHPAHLLLTWNEWHLVLTAEHFALNDRVQMAFGIVGTRMVQLVLQGLSSISWNHLLVLDLHVIVVILLLYELSVHLLVVHLLHHWRQGLVSLLKAGPLRWMLVLH